MLSVLFPGANRTPFERICDMLTEHACEALLRDFGGRRVYVPRDPGAAHPLSVSLGIDAARLLAREMSGEYVDIPVAPARRAQIIDLDRKGFGPAEIQRRVKCSRRLVFKVLAEAKAAKPEEPRLL
ncbi:MAG: hypothetical protein ACXW3D_01280 [Caulobacteraceae bacterium]